MPYVRRVVQRLALPVVLVTALLIPAVAPAAKAPVLKTWATVNVCDTTASPDTIGLRGSMPGLSTKGATMWMRFAVQYRTPSKAWKPAAGLDTGYLRIGTAKVRSRQAGHSFKVKPPAGGEAFVLRGLVTFQWRSKGGKALDTERRITTAGHKSTAGADPAGYSAATCTIT